MYAAVGGQLAGARVKKVEDVTFLDVQCSLYTSRTQVIQLEHSQRNNAAWKQVTCIVQCKQGRTGGRPSSGQIWSQGGEEEEEEEGEARTSRKYLLSVSGSHFLADQSMSAGSFNYCAKYRVQVTAGHK